MRPRVRGGPGGVCLEDRLRGGGLLLQLVHRQRHLLSECLAPRPLFLRTPGSCGPLYCVQGRFNQVVLSAFNGVLLKRPQIHYELPENP